MNFTKFSIALLAGIVISTNIHAAQAPARVLRKASQPAQQLLVFGPPIKKNETAKEREQRLAKLRIEDERKLRLLEIEAARNARLQQRQARLQGTTVSQLEGKVR